MWPRIEPQVREFQNLAPPWISFCRCLWTCKYTYLTQERFLCPTSWKEIIPQRSLWQGREREGTWQLFPSTGSSAHFVASMDLCKSTYLRVPDLSILVWVCKIDIAPKMLHTTIAPQCIYELALTYIFDNSLSSKHTNAIIGKSLKIFWLRAWNEVMAYKWNTRAFFLCIYIKKRWSELL